MIARVEMLFTWTQMAHWGRPGAALQYKYVMLFSLFSKRIITVLFNFFLISINHFASNDILKCARTAHLFLIVAVLQLHCRGRLSYHAPWLYPKPLELQVGGKGTQPHELRWSKCFRLVIVVSEGSQAAKFVHTKCNAVDDWGEWESPTTLQVQGRRV